jgi:signal transduction histidine kinase
MVASIAARARRFSAEVAKRSEAVRRFDATDGAATLQMALRELREEHEALLVADEELRVQSEELQTTLASAEVDRQRHREVFDAIADVLLIVDDSGVVQDANRAALGFLALDRRRVRGKPLSALLERQDIRGWYAALRELKIGAHVVRLPIHVRRRGSPSIAVVATCSLFGDGKHVLVNAHPSAPAVPHTTAELERALRDTKELLARERAERERLEDQVRGIARFVEGLSNGLRGPMQAVIGWANLLMRETLAKPARDGALSVIARSVRLQLGVLDELLDIARVTTGGLPFEMQSLDLAALVRRVCDGFSEAARDADVSVAIDTPDEPLSVFGDRSRLERVVSALVSNAIKFSRRGGHVHASASKDGAHVVLRISDDGRGIEPAKLETLFAGPTRARGDDAGGFGLYVAHQIVELHSGTLRAESDGANRGATFILSLPERIDAERSAHPRLAGLRVLIVEDDRDTRELLGALLTDRGASTSVTNDAADAIAVVHTFRPDVIVSGIAEGDALVRGLRQIAPDVPTIALGHDGGMAEPWFDAHLSKPLVLSDVLRTIADLAAD